ncbi:MAG: tyrosine--tRNA ligase [Gammaproteobacteria bacterium]|nr:tyrosine--tRNA ligase [Gammaproteobacteria bacterium]
MVSQVIDDLRARGMVAQVSNEDDLIEHLSSGMRTVYCGFDPTADSLHIGNLVPLLALRRFQLAGHRPVLLVGGATGMIGDPGGRNTERELKPAEEVRRSVERIRHQAMQFLDFDQVKNAAVVVNNADWIAPLNVIDFLRDIGKHFSVNAMIQKETVRRRLEDDSNGISYTEFSYSILQSYDFVTLHDQYDCTIQMGGSDQWGNITAGIDLMRRMSSAKGFAITYPLVTASDGTKFGKSMGNAVWLDAAQTSPYRFYQFWLNVTDEDVVNYLRTFTFLSVDDIGDLETHHLADPGAREAHRTLAREVTRLVHGDEGVDAAERISEALFRNQLRGLDGSDMAQLALDGMESTTVGNQALLMDVLVDCGLAVTPRGQVTRGQARKLIEGNSISVNGEKVTDTDARLTSVDSLHGRFNVVQKGKKQHHLVIVASE